MKGLAWKGDERSHPRETTRKEREEEKERQKGRDSNGNPFDTVEKAG
jgi:hypothetical protein